ncbi:rho GTPase-activating protein 21-like isoform X2 [Festucalex cinctus]
MSHLKVLDYVLHNNWSLLCDLYCAWNSQAKQKDGTDPSETSAVAPSPGPQEEEEPFSWPGPKTLCLRRTSQGFGFTLRHFIVYPPESAVHNSLKDEENGSRGRQRSRLEPMDTIFVKQVKDGGPAHGAGLCTGDRIVKVNGESIIGKTYSQVIALIQNSDASLELCVMPKDEDILQLFSRDITALAYSQDAYLKGNAAYSGNAHSIPEPPPICYPRVEIKSAGKATLASDSPQAAAGRATEKSLSVEIALPPSPQTVVCACNDNSRPATTTSPERADRAVRSAWAGPSRKTEDTRRRPSAETEAAPPLSLPPGCAPPPPRLSSRPDNSPLRASRSPDALSPNTERRSPSPAGPSPHHNIDWRTYTTYKDYIDAKRLHTYGCRTIQERLDSLRAAAANSNSGSAYSQQRSPSPCAAPRAPAVSPLRWRSASTDRGAGRGTPFRSSSHERLGGSEPGRHWPRSASQNALVGGAKSLDHPGRHAALEDRLLLCQGEEARASRQGAGQRLLPHHRSRASGGPSNSHLSDGTCDGKPPLRMDSDTSRPSRPPLTNSVSESSAAAKSPMSHVTGNHLGPPPRLELRTHADSLKMESGSDAGLVGRSSSCAGPVRGRTQSAAGASSGANRAQKSSVRMNGSQAEGVEGLDAAVVVLRKEKNAGATRARPPSCVFAVCDQRGGAGGKSSPALLKAASADAVASWSNSCRELRLRRLAGAPSQNLDDSLDAIPFIDEPSSPSMDLDTINIPASAVISAAIPPNPSATSPLMRRHMSHEHDSLRLAIIESDSGGKTERSLSYDEGLDNYREDGGRRSLIAGLKGLRKAMDRSSEDSGSRRDSSSDIFCDAAREGLLHFKQLNADKGKRAGVGGARSWKPTYAVLRGHHLCLYKDKKDGRALTSSDEPLPVISVRACLIDISYSDTKRKNVLRLTTSDREYLFQAEDRDDMLAWIRVIRESAHLDQENAAFSSHELISRKIREYNNLMSPTGGKTEPSPRSSRQSLSIRQTLLGGKGDAKTPSPHSPKPEQDKKNAHKDESSPPKDKVTWRKGIPGLMRKPFERKVAPGVTFGVRLDDCPPAHANKFVPLIVEVCCKLVEERGLEYTGIYRVPGNNAAISNMQDELNNKGMNDINVQDDKWRDLNVISSLLKSFFRKLPEPLFTNDRYADFIEANRIDEPVERLKVLKRLLHELPRHHYETLKFLSAHLKTVADNSEKNKMEPRNLAIVFGPTLVRTTEDNMMHMVTHMPDQYKIVETLIQNYEWFFTEEGNGDPVTFSHEESAVESQPVPNIDHLLTNIGRTGTPQGEVSDSPTSDSAKSKTSWSSGKEQCSRELLVSSIFGASGRKRNKSKDKMAASSSDDDLDAVVFSLAGRKAEPPPDDENGRSAQTRQAKSAPSPEVRRGKATSSSDPPSSDLGTLDSVAKTWSGEPDVHSVTSDYSTTSSVTFPTGGDEADDERGGEGRPAADTDSDGDFPIVFARSTPRPRKDDQGSKMAARRLFPAHKMMEGNTLARRRKTDSEPGGGEGRADAPARLARVLEVMKKGRSTGSLGSPSEAGTWHLKIAQRIKSRLRAASDDDDATDGRRRNDVRRRHTMADQRDLAQLAAVHDWPPPGRPKPRRASQDSGIRDRIDGRGSGDTEDAPPANGKSVSPPGDDAHPHKLSGVQVVRSRFSQYL